MLVEQAPDPLPCFDVCAAEIHCPLKRGGISSPLVTGWSVKKRHFKADDSRNVAIDDKYMYWNKYAH